MLALALALVVALGAGGCASPDLSSAPTLTVGFIFVGRHDDLGYNQAAWEGSEELAKAYPDLRIIRQENVPENPAAEQVLEGMIEQGATVLFATSFGHLDAATAVAMRHPNVIVLHEGGTTPPGRLRNFGTFWGTVYEPVYLAGIAAGAATRTHRLGFVAAFPIPATFLNVNAFELGARSVDPQATTHLVFTGNWCDPAKQAPAATALIAEGVDVLTQHQDCTRTVLETAEKAHIFSVGYHADGSEIAPKGWLVGSVWHWGPLMIDMMRTILAGTFAGSPFNGDFRGGLRPGDNPFVLSAFGPLISDATQHLIQQEAQRFRAGHSPFDGPIVDRDGRTQVTAGVTPTVAQLDAMDYLVPGVTGEREAQ